MDPRRIAHAITALLFGLLSLAWFLHHNAQWQKRGLDAYLAYQTRLFARQPHPIGFFMISVFMGLLILWFYEFVARLIAKMQNPPAA